MNAVSVSAAKARRFDPAGHCIYCGGDGKLTKEHIYTQGLSGGLILPDASCATCQKEIHSFETICMRQSKRRTHAHCRRLQRLRPLRLDSMHCAPRGSIRRIWLSAPRRFGRGFRTGYCPGTTLQRGRWRAGH
jgi:hypothetical protein